MAGRKPILRIGGDSSEARRAVDELKGKVEEFRHTSAEMRVQVKTEAAEIQLEAVKRRIENLSKQEATPRVKVATARAFAELERIERKIHSIDHSEIRVGVVGSLSGAIGGAVSKLSQGAGSLLGALPGVGGALGAIGAESAASAPLVLALAAAVAALVASLISAVAGLGALAVALAAAFGPIVAVGIAAVAKLVEVFKALSAQHKSTATSAQQVASTHEQVAAATDQVASAQDNLRQATTSAYQAWADSIENVKDDLLAVAHAQLGIQDAALSLREAQQALKDFRSQAGAGVGDNLIAKLTDVNFKGSIKGALSGAAPGLSGDDELQLERLILNVKEAKLGEKDATDALHDSNVKLSRDRQTEAAFVRQGIAAYPGYRSALEGLTSAQRALATAQHASAAAAVAQHSALSKLSPVERQLAATITNTKRLLEGAFGPAVTAVLGGINRGLKIFSATLTDPKIRAALADLGQAMGNAFVILAATLSTPAMRALFAQLITGAAQLVRVLSSRVFGDLLSIFLQLARDAMPALLSIFGRLADILDRWAAWISEHPKRFQKDLDGFIHSTRIWGSLILHTIELVAKIATALAPIGDAIVTALLHPIRTAQQAFNFFVDSMKKYADHIGDLGRQWGHAFANGFHSVTKTFGQIVKGIVSDATAAVNAFITGIDAVIRAINSLPHLNTPLGRVGFPHIGTIDPIGGSSGNSDNTPSHGRRRPADLGGSSGSRRPRVQVPQVLPDFTRQLRQQLVAAMRLPDLTPALAGAGGHAGHHTRQQPLYDHPTFHIHVTTPPGHVPDAGNLALQIERKMRQRGQW